MRAAKLDETNCRLRVVTVGYISLYGSLLVGYTVGYRPILYLL